MKAFILMATSLGVVAMVIGVGSIVAVMLGMVTDVTLCVSGAWVALSGLIVLVCSALLDTMKGYRR